MEISRVVATKTRCTFRVSRVFSTAAGHVVTYAPAAVSRAVTSPVATASFRDGPHPELHKILHYNPTRRTYDLQEKVNSD
eukprot:COSAG02_NODE_31550_length_531_cov_1.342593_1_plen_79_part_10